MFPTLTKQISAFLTIPNVDQAVFKPKIDNVDQS